MSWERPNIQTEQIKVWVYSLFIAFRNIQLCLGNDKQRVVRQVECEQYIKSTIVLHSVLEGSAVHTIEEEFRDVFDIEVWRHGGWLILSKHRVDSGMAIIHVGWLKYLQTLHQGITTSK